jgi:hypothetical protein
MMFSSNSNDSSGSNVSLIAIFVGLFSFMFAVLASAFLSAAYLSVVAVFMYCILTIIGIVPPQPLL